jgi:putative tricarboxylic transport membrane protein
MFQVYALIGFGLLGYFLRKFGFEPGPLPMAFVLAPLIENSLRQSLLMSQGSASIFVSRPISATLLGIFALLVISQGIKLFRTRKREVHHTA